MSEAKFHPHRFNVMSKCCGQCLFSANKIVSDSRKNGIIETCIKNESWFVCHKSNEGQEICCAGFFHNENTQTRAIQMANRLGIVNYVDEDTLTSSH